MFYGYRQTVKFIQRGKRHRIPYSIEEGKVGRLMIFNAKNYYDATVIKTVLVLAKVKLVEHNKNPWNNSHK